jgi:hypothetical protein
MSIAEGGPATPGRARKWFRRVLKLSAWGCGGTLLLFVLLFWGLFAFLDRVPKSYPPAAKAIEPPMTGEYAAQELDGFDSPYLGHTGSWDGKGGGMFGLSKVSDLDWEAGMGLRWTFMTVHWSALEPAGPVDLAGGVPPAWQELDGFLVEAQKRGLNVLMQPTIGGNAGGPPRWAGRRAPGKSAPRDMAAASAFAGKLAARYKPGGTLAIRLGWGPRYGVRAWELDNEPNVYLTHWGGQAGDYAEFATSSAARIKQEDPRAMILLPATTGGGDAMAWVQAALDGPSLNGSPEYRRLGVPHSIGPAADGVSFHNYEGLDSTFAGVPRTIERVCDDIRDTFETMESRDAGFPYSRKREYWHTEGNYDFIGALSAERRAAWRIQFFTRAFAAGIRKVCVMDASRRDHAAVKAYVAALPRPFPMHPAEAEVKVVQGQARAFRHPDDDGPGTGCVWVFWAVADTGDARVDLPAAGERVTLVHVDGSSTACQAFDHRVTVELKGDKKMAPPVLVIDRPGS